MTEVLMIDITALLLERDDMDAGIVQQLRSGLAESPSQYSNLRDAAEKLELQYESGGDKKKLALKLGVANYFLGRMSKAAELLEQATGALAKFYLGVALNEVKRHDEAVKALTAAGKSGYAVVQVELNKAAAYIGLGKLDEAQKTLDGLDDYVHATAEYQFQYGSLQMARGDWESAVDSFEKAVEADDRHAGALFQLAHLNDRNGNDEEAIDLYERCLKIPPAHVGTLINLGILYEDHERYDRASHCFEQVLRVYPNHSRARLFKRDSGAAGSQFYDEEAERRNDKYNAVLDIPVTDFELSVRSRNCLKKMDIHNLGDLTRCTEQTLLASKNFGETSLHEIKEMLEMKGLRLGQSLEQQPKRSHPSINLDEYSPQEQAMLNKPVSELNLSVRSRKCMTKLNISTIGELISHTGDELLECKNFGVTSLVEVRDKLSVVGLKLRGE